MNFIYLFVALCLSGYAHSDGSLLLIERGIDEYIQTNKKPEYLQNAFDSLFKTKNKAATNKATCDMCVIVTDAVLKLRRNGASRATILEFGKDICVWFVINKRPLCAGYLNLQIDAALYIIDKHPKLTAEHICAIKFQEYDCIDPEYDPWSINIPPRVESIQAHTNLVGNQTDEEYVLHLTDFHYDPLYEPGANTECEFFICCQNTNGKAADPEKGAGYWGDYSPSNTPLHSVQDLLKQVVKQHPKIDRIYFTGDIVSHKTWASSKEDNSNSIQKIMSELKNTFKSIPIFPILGNHEAHPTDLFSPSDVIDDNLSTQWLLDLVAEEWSNWLPNDTQSTIRKGGYYTVLIKPGFRIIGLNTNLCYTYNLWLIDNNNDPHEQLQWLVDTLAAAEKNKETVHIVSHVPPGDKTCLRQWNHEYRRIVDRFSNVITGQFHGHTHTDELKIFYSLENTNKVVNVAFIGGSITTFTGLNPNYRMYTVDATTWRVNDYEQWMFNLKEANKFPDRAPNWYKLYSFKDAYGLKQLDLPAYHELLQKMATNTSLIEQYRRFRVRESEVRLNKSCDKECLSDMFCSISNVEFEDSLQCKAFKTKFYKI